MTNQNHPQHAAFENMGQVEVTFLGQRIVIGCVEGEKQETLHLAKRFEIDAGEVQKVVTAPIEPIQTMLMVGIIEYDHFEKSTKIAEK